MNRRTLQVSGLLAVVLCGLFFSGMVYFGAGWWTPAAEDLSPPLSSIDSATPSDNSNDRSDAAESFASFPRAAVADDQGLDLEAPRITGRVLDHHGRPITHAVVTALESAATPEDAFAEELTTESKTDRNGEFSLECSAVGFHRVEVSALGYAIETLFDCRAGDRLEVVLSIGASISGRVCSPVDGSPIVGIEVRAGGQITTSNLDGLYQLDGLHPGVHILHTESHWEGWAGAFEKVDLAPDDHPWIDLILTEGAILVGRVVDRRSYSPIPDAEIRRPDGRVLAITDEGGRYRIDGNPKNVGLQSFIASAPGFAEEVGRPLAREDSVQLLNFAMSPALSLRGRITDGTAPVEDARVRLYAHRLGEGNRLGETSGIAQECRSDARGLFEFEELIAGAFRYYLSVEAPGFADHAQEFSIRGAEPATLEDIELVPESIVEGVVIDEWEEPQCDVEVSISRDFHRKVDPRARAVTDEFGRFRIDGLAPGRMMLHPIREDLVRDVQMVEIAEAGSMVSLEVVVEPARSISGVVENRYRQPQAGVEVECQSEDGYPFVRTTRTDAAGSFVFYQLREGSYRLRARTDDDGEGGVLVGVHPDAGCERIILEPLPSITGRVVDTTGEPIPGAYLHYIPPIDGLGSEQSTVADAEGRFSFAVEAREGRGMVIAWPSEGAYLTSAVEGDSPPFADVLEPQGVVHHCSPGDSIDPLMISSP